MTYKNYQYRSIHIMHILLISMLFVSYECQKLSINRLDNKTISIMNKNIINE